MPLDMIGDHRHKPTAHYRRYLHAQYGLIVVCVTDFDYYDYDASRFVDLSSFDSEVEAEVVPITTDDVVTQMIGLEGDRVATAQSLRLIQAIRRLSLRGLV